MILKYTVNNHFDHTDHWVCFPHWLSAFLYARRIKSKVIRMNKEKIK